MYFSINLQDQFALALSQAVGSTGKKDDELVGSKLNKVNNALPLLNKHSNLFDEIQTS